MIASLKTIGIEKGKPFKPDEKTKSILDSAAREAHEMIAMNYEPGFANAFYKGTRWALPISKETSGRDGQHVRRPEPVRHRWPGGDVLHGIFQSEGFWRWPILSHEHQRPGRQTIGREQDLPPQRAAECTSGAILVGDGIRSPDTRADPGNVTLQPRLERHSGTEESRRLHGHLLRFQSASRQESNWVPTDPKPQFELLFRLYGPKKEFFEKT